MIVLHMIVSYRVIFHPDSRTVPLFLSKGARTRAPYLEAVEPQTCPMQVRLQTPFRLPDQRQGFGRQPGQFPLQTVWCLQFGKVTPHPLGNAGVEPQVNDSLASVPTETQLEKRPTRTAVLDRNNPLPPKGIVVGRLEPEVGQAPQRPAVRISARGTAEVGGFELAFG